jgi:hypothetical protein
MNGLLALSVIASTFVLLLLLTRRLPAAGKRPLPSYQTLRKQIAHSIESGRPIQVNLGRASLIAQSTATSLAALHILRYLTRSGHHHAAANVGDGTLLPAAPHAQVLATAANPFAYASGTVNETSHAEPTALVTVGHHGAEAAFIGYAGQQQGLTHLFGSDSPEGLAVAMAATDQQLIGEDLLAAAAYLDGQPAQIASLYLQDIARWLLAALLLALALYRWVS